MPLHGDEPSPVLRLDRFDDAVGRRGGDDEPVRRALDRLVVPAVDVDLRPSGDPGKARSRLDRHRVIAPVLLLRQAVRDLRRPFQRQVLHERAAAGDVDHLESPADPEDRNV